MKAPLIVTLIHGTWGKNAPFTRPNSSLRRAITDLINPVAGLDDQPGAHISFLRIGSLPFDWKGANGNFSRRTASTDLANFLAKTILKYPHHRHIVIAHSHGGNVLLYALEKLPLPLSSRVAGIVTVGTPFLFSDGVSAGAEVMNHLITGALRNPMRSIPLILIGLGMLPFSISGGLLPTSGPRSLDSSPGLSFLSMLTITAVSLLMMFSLRKQFESSKHWADLLKVAPPRSRMLCLFAAYDAIGTWLTILSTLRGAMQIGLFVTVAALFAIAYISGIFAFIYVAPAWLSGRLWQMSSLNDVLKPLNHWFLEHDRFFFVASAAAFTALIAIVVLTVLITLLDLLAFAPAGFGLAEWRHGWFTQQRSSLHPPAAFGAQAEEVPIAELVREFGSFKAVTDLRHSILFEHRGSLAKIQAFIESCDLDDA